MKIFGLQIRPELNDWRYYLHLILIAVIVLGILQLFLPADGMFNIKNILISSGLIGIADVVVHTGLNLS